MITIILVVYKSDKNKLNCEIIFCEDGSIDNSYKELVSIRNNNPNIKIIKFFV